MFEILDIVRQAISVFSQLLTYLILARVLLSWLPMISRDNGLIRMLYALTEPILGPIRKMLAKSPLGGAGMPLDFSAVFAALAIQIVHMLVDSVIVSIMREILASSLM